MDPTTANPTVSEYTRRDARRNAIKRVDGKLFTTNLSPAPFPQHQRLKADADAEFLGELQHRHRRDLPWVTVAECL